MANGTTEDTSKFDPRTKWIPATVFTVGLLALFTGGRWFERISTQSAATVPISTQLSKLQTSVDGMSGKMELVIGVRDDVLRMKEQIASMERRQTELFSMLETNRAYTIQLTRIMDDRGMPVPPAPPPSASSNPRE